jgi:phosphoribosyl-AMP cyclohydrolase
MGLVGRGDLPLRSTMTAMPVATPVPVSAVALASIRYDANGLVAAIIQDHDSRAVLMMGWMNAESLAETLATGRTVFWSRSRQERWRKGDTSGDRQWVREAYYDCDGDTLLFLVEQEGRGACHTGARSCFYRSFASPAPAPTESTGREVSADQGPGRR